MARDPAIDRFAAAFRAGDHATALVLVDELVARYPQSAGLHWYRAQVLEKLERPTEAREALDQVLAMQPAHVAARLARVRLAGELLYQGEDGEAEEELSEAEEERRVAEQERAQEEYARWAEGEYREALRSEPDNVDALAGLGNVLSGRSEDETAREEGSALLDRAIQLAPDRVDLLEQRAQARSARAMLWDEDEGGGEDGPDVVRTMMGMRYSRSLLEGALADYERCLSLAGGRRHASQAARILHELGRYDEALAHWDRVLAETPEDDPRREFILEQRRRSENQGVGERELFAEQMAELAQGDGRDRSLEDDFTAQALAAIGQAVRGGESVQEALEPLASGDPDDLLALGIAQQILSAVYEAPPELEEVDVADYPAWQRRWLERSARALATAGFEPVVNAEATGLFPLLGQHVAIGVHADPAREMAVASYALRPKWPGWLGFIVLLLTGKWRTVRMLEALSHFHDGTHLLTQWVNPSPFETGGAVQVEQLPRSTAAAALVARHRERVDAHKAVHSATAMPVHGLEDIEALWRAGQEAKRAHRAVIGHVTETELRRLLGGQYDRLAAKVRAQVERLAPAFLDRG